MIRLICVLALLLVPIAAGIPVTYIGSVSAPTTGTITIEMSSAAGSDTTTLTYAGTPASFVVNHLETPGAPVTVLVDGVALLEVTQPLPGTVVDVGELDVTQTAQVTTVVTRNAGGGGGGDCTTGYTRTGGTCIKDAPRPTTTARTDEQATGEGTEDTKTDRPQTMNATDEDVTSVAVPQSNLITGAVVGGGTTVWPALLVVMMGAMVLAGYAYWRRRRT